LTSQKTIVHFDIQKDIDNMEWSQFWKNFIRPFELCDFNNDFLLSSKELYKCFIS
jgi:hypothetical protein